jgi:hypothetical protein
VRGAGGLWRHLLLLPLHQLQSVICAQQPSKCSQAEQLWVCG